MIVSHVRVARWTGSDQPTHPANLTLEVVRETCGGCGPAISGRTYVPTYLLPSYLPTYRPTDLPTSLPTTDPACPLGHPTHPVPSAILSPRLGALRAPDPLPPCLGPTDHGWMPSQAWPDQRTSNVQAKRAGVAAAASDGRSSWS